MKYYYREHLEGYDRVAREGKRAWGEIHGDEEGFDAFSSRTFLSAAVERLRFGSTDPHALEYGCGTGPGACFLAERGFRVHGIDLIPAAIDIARRIATERDLTIDYAVQDICTLPADGPRYDLIVDSHCLQGIVLEDDRRLLFHAVHERLAPNGYYLVSSAVFDPARYQQEAIVDDASRREYHRYGDGLFAADTSIVYTSLGSDRGGHEDAVAILGEWWLPNRCHRTADALERELQAAGFSVLHADGGNFVCIRDDAVGHITW